MRRTAIAVMALLLATGCGGSSAGKPAAKPFKVDASTIGLVGAKTTAAKTARMTMSSDSLVGGQHVKMSSAGVLSFDGKLGDMAMTIGGVMGGPEVKLHELLTDGYMYLSISGQSGYYKIKLADLIGTNLAQGANPANGLAALAAAGSSVKTVGTETVRGEQTTHVRGVIDGVKAQAQLGGAMKGYLKSLFGNSKPGPIPFDAWVDDQGRMRKLVEHVTVTVKGQKVTGTTTNEFYDFGTKVVVKAPPASEVKDGAMILNALKTMGG